MDIGVGAFIVASASTSSFARHKHTCTSCSIYEITITKLINYIRISNLLNLLVSNQRNAVVLLLGVGRMVVLRMINYHEHNSEYGTHWNFFVTLFCVWCIADVIKAFVPSSIIPFFAVFLTSIHQYLLSYTDLTSYIFNAPRNDFFSHNREGIYSLFGYVSLYLAAEWYSKSIFFSCLVCGHQGHQGHPGHRGGDLHLPASPTLGASSNNSNGKEVWVKDMDIARDHKNANTLCNCTVDGAVPPKHWNRLVRLLLLDKVSLVTRYLFMSCVVTYLLWYTLDANVQSASRRLANVTYIVFVAFSSLCFLFISQVVEDLTCAAANQVIPIPKIVLGMCDYQMHVFMAANLFTGIVNMTINTIHANSEMALVILVVYVAFICKVSTMLIERKK